MPSPILYFFAFLGFIFFVLILLALFTGSIEIGSNDEEDQF